MRRDEQHVVPCTTPRGRLWACAYWLPPRERSRILALRAAAFPGCLYRAYATPGVAKEIVDSALVFDNGEVASGLKNNDDAVQCLRAAARFTTGTGSVAAGSRG